MNKAITDKQQRKISRNLHIRVHMTFMNMWHTNIKRHLKVKPFNKSIFFQQTEQIMSNVAL